MQKNTRVCLKKTNKKNKKNIGKTIRMKKNFQLGIIKRNFYFCDIENE